MKNPMPTKNALAALFPVLLAGFVMTTGVEAQKGQEPKEVKEPVKVEKLQAGAPLEFTVTGLTKANLEQVRMSLTSMTTEVFVCDGCRHEQPVAGTCLPCNHELKAKKEAVLLDATPNVESASIRLTPAAARNLRFSDLSSVLMKNSIEIDPAKFPIAGKSRLMLRGGTLDTSEAIEKALVESKLFESVKAKFDPLSGETHVMLQAKKTAPTHAQVTSILDKVGTGTKLVDVIWGPLPAPAKIG